MPCGPSPPLPHAGRNLAIPAAAPIPPSVLSASRRFIIRRAYGKTRGSDAMKLVEIVSPGRPPRAPTLQQPHEPAHREPEPERRAEARRDGDEQDPGHRVAPEPDRKSV